MKQFIVMSATVALGVFLYGLIAGQGEASLTGALSGVWQSGIAARTYAP